MKGKTHAALTLATIDIYMEITTKTSIFDNLSNENVYFLGGIVLGSTFPDVDLAWNRNIQIQDRSIFQHRGITHTPIFLLGMIFLWLAYSFINPTFESESYYAILYPCFKGFILGNLFHILQDCLTKLGGPLFFPFVNINKKVSLSEMKSCGLVDFAIFCVCFAFLIFEIYQSKGFIVNNYFNGIQANIETIKTLINF